ncbi:hypothetical protein [Plantactinospora sp. KLBMP9567]|uniref:hypothetical protein n=1 Tax=Plantactinospora sp. KLBMP9567 TaxID=3085900 RepID=UPI002982267C|nr:hypothetical protein [Plantactinospora sp. KLBMP9567]MDW5327948.1 hypothetical protein [Plantactinospora sp. KLBMP9567]
MASERFAINAVTVDRHANIWQAQSDDLREVVQLLEGFRLRDVSRAGMFARVVQQHDALVDVTGTRLSEGAEVWSAIAQMLRISYQKFVDDEEQAVAEFVKLRDAAAADRGHPLRGALGMAR